MVALTLDTWLGIAGIVLSVVSLLLHAFRSLSPLRIRFDHQKAPVLRVGEVLECVITIRNRRGYTTYVLPPSLEGKFRAGKTFDMESVSLEYYLTREAIPDGRPIPIGPNEKVILRARHKAVHKRDHLVAWYQIHEPGAKRPPKRSRKFRICVQAAGGEAQRSVPVQAKDSAERPEKRRL